MNRNLTTARAAAMLRAYKQTPSIAKVARLFGVSEPTVSKWIPYSGLDAKWLLQIKTLEGQLRRTKLSMARQKRHLKIATSVIKSLQQSANKRSLIATSISAAYSITRSVANKIVGLSGNCGSHHNVPAIDHILLVAMRNHLALNPGRGFSGMYNAFLRHQPGNRHRALRLYTEHLLEENRSKKAKKTFVFPVKHLARQGKANAMWSMDFMQDALTDGRKFWLLNITDDFNREAISTLVLRARSAKAVTEHLQSIIDKGRQPERIRTDNGAEFRSVCYQRWANKRSIIPVYIRPGKPTENSFVERFNGTVRREVLSRYLFKSLSDVQKALDDWRLSYNFSRPHSALGGLSPMQYGYAHDWYISERSGWR